MKVCTTNSLLYSQLESLKTPVSNLGFAPTMGALHQGHLSLITKACDENDVVVVSIFVNPTQFNNPIDLEEYPRDLERDLELINAIGYDKIIVYAPDSKIIYQDSISKTNFDFGGLDHQMEGKFRPGHFNGVGTVLKKLFEIIRPDKAYFGEKDFQQLQIVKKLVKIIGIPTNIIACPIIREANGLAMSSRNSRLSTKERGYASKIYKTLKAVELKFKKVTMTEIKKWVQFQFDKDPFMNLEYFEISEASTLESVVSIEPNKKYRAFIAVLIRDVRLIDNIALN